jgi:hypothetical protein
MAFTDMNVTNSTSAGLILDPIGKKSLIA